MLLGVLGSPTGRNSHVLVEGLDRPPPPALAGVAPDVACVVSAVPLRPVPLKCYTHTALEQKGYKLKGFKSLYRNLRPDSGLGLVKMFRIYSRAVGRGALRREAEALISPRFLDLAGVIPEPKTLNPKSQTLNPKSSTLNPSLGSPNPQPSTPNPKP